jgi:hypothetical protein
MYNLLFHRYQYITFSLDYLKTTIAWQYCMHLANVENTVAIKMRSLG